MEEFSQNHLSNFQAEKNFLIIMRKPVDIAEIQKRIDEEHYEDMDGVEKNFMLMCKNTQHYNEDGSLIFEDSIVIQSVFTNAKSRIEREPDEADDDDDNSRRDVDEGSRASSGSSAKKKKEGRSSKKKKLYFHTTFVGHPVQL